MIYQSLVYKCIRVGGDDFPLILRFIGHQTSNNNSNPFVDDNLLHGEFICCFCFNYVGASSTFFKMYLN